VKTEDEKQQDLRDLLNTWVEGGDPSGAIVARLEVAIAETYCATPGMTAHKALFLVPAMVANHMVRLAQVAIQSGALTDEPQPPKAPTVSDVGRA